MRNKRLIIAVLAAVAFGLVAAVSVSRYLANAQAYTKNLNNVVVAKVEIPVGSRIIALRKVSFCNFISNQSWTLLPSLAVLTCTHSLYCQRSGASSKTDLEKKWGVIII